MGNKDAILKIIFDAQDKTQKAFASVNKSLKNLEPTFRKMRNTGALAFGALSAGSGLLVRDAMDIDRVADTFTKLTQSMGATPKAIETMRKSTMGLVNDLDLMKSGNKLMAMGLAETEEEMGNLMNIATRLGGAMGEGPTQAMENFALMLANQSILRLDTFGISSGKVRARMAELTTGIGAVDRETAFMTATMEQAQMSLDKLGEVVLTPAEKLKAMSITISNMKNTIGNAFIPILAEMAEALKPVIDKVIAWVNENPKLVAQIALGATAIAGLVAVLGTVGLIIVSVTASIGALTVIFNPLGIIIMAVVGFLTYLYNSNEQAREAMDRLWEVTKVVAKWLAEFFVATIKLVIDIFLWLGEVIYDVVAFMAGIFIDTINILVGAFNLWWSGIKAIGNIFLWLGEIIYKAIGSAFGAMKGWINNAIGAFNALGDVITGSVSSAIDRVTGLISGMVDKLKSAWKWIKKIGGKVADAVSSVAETVVPSFAFGGTVPGAVGSPQLIQAHGGEVVLPYNRRNSGGGGVSVNINGGMYLDETSADMIGNRILERVNSHIIL